MPEIASEIRRRVPVTSQKLASAGLRFLDKGSARAHGRTVAAALVRTLATQDEAILSIERAQLALREVSVPQEQELSFRRGLSIGGLRVPNGPMYPFRRSFIIDIQETAQDTRAWLEDLPQLLEGRGDSADHAIEHLARELDKLVGQHWRKPAHLLTPEDEAVNHILDNLIDWEAFHALNPVEQPLWGKVVRRLSKDEILVHWFLGPNEERDKEAVLDRKDVYPSLLEIPVGNWFYGAGKVYPERISWTRYPVEVPDPRDPRAVKEAWDLIPRKVISETGAWPLRAKE